VAVQATTRSPRYFTTGAVAVSSLPATWGLKRSLQVSIREGGLLAALDTCPTMTTRPVLFIQWTSRESTHITTSDSARKPIGICCHLLLTVHLFNVHGRPLDEATQQSYSCWFAGSNNWVAGENSAHTVAFLEGADGCPAIEQNRSRRSD
jgi:hypothetical protein